MGWGALVRLAQYPDNFQEVPGTVDTDILAIGDGHVNFDAVFQEAQLLEFFDMLQASRREGDKPVENGFAERINPHMAVVKGSGSFFPVPGNGSAGKIKRLPFI